METDTDTHWYRVFLCVCVRLCVCLCTHDTNGGPPHLRVAANEKGALPVDVKRVELLVALEGVEAPPLLWLAPLRRLVVLENNALEGVGLKGRAGGRFR